MIPYFELPVYHLGPFPVHVFGICLVAAIFTGVFITLRRAKRFSIDRRHMEHAASWALVCGLMGAHVAKLALDYTPIFQANPWIVIQTARGIRSVGAFWGGLVGVVGYCAAYRVGIMTTWAMLDVIAYALPFS